MHVHDLEVMPQLVQHQAEQFCVFGLGDMLEQMELAHDLRKAVERGKRRRPEHHPFVRLDIHLEDGTAVASSEVAMHDAVERQRAGRIGGRNGDLVKGDQRVIDGSPIDRVIELLHRNIALGDVQIPARIVVDTQRQRCSDIGKIIEQDIAAIEVPAQPNLVESNRFLGFERPEHRQGTSLTLVRGERRRRRRPGLGVVADVELVSARCGLLAHAAATLEGRTSWVQRGPPRRYGPSGNLPASIRSARHAACGRRRDPTHRGSAQASARRWRPFR